MKNPTREETADLERSCFGSSGMRWDAIRARVSILPSEIKKKRAATGRTS